MAVDVSHASEATVCYSMHTIRDNNCKWYFVSNACTKQCQYQVIFQIN
jgi:hypothetical protein